MKKTLLFTSLSSLLITSFVSAQQTTFNFTTGTPFQQTVNGITCTVKFEPENSGMTIGELTDNAGLISSDGLWMGKQIGPATAKERIGFSRPGASITFSHDVRLKSYTIEKRPNTEASLCYLRGGNVTALATHLGTDDSYTGERSFALECVVPAGTPLLSCLGSRIASLEWRFSSLTVEPETYVAPVIPIPEGNETGITRIALAQFTYHKHSYALKNGRLHRWTSNGLFLSRDFIFDGAESGVLDFTVQNNVSKSAVLIETVEGYALFQYHGTLTLYYVTPLEGTLPSDPDQIFVADGSADISSGIFVMALKDGMVYFDGPSKELMEATMPAAISSGGVSEIAAGTHTAMAVKDGKLYVWGDSSSGGFSILDAPIPEAITNGEVLHLAAYEFGAVVQLATGELIDFAHSSASLTPDQTSGELFADVRYEENTVITLRHDGSFFVEDARRGKNTPRLSNGYNGPFYEINPVEPKEDFLLRGLEIPPSIVQQLGYEQIAFGEENAAALLPGGRMIIWGGVDIDVTSYNSAFPTQADAVPSQINDILFPQTNVAEITNSDAPDAAELSMLEAGGLGIQWGASNTPYEVQTTTDMLGGEWESLPTDANNRFYRINPVPSN